VKRIQQLVNLLREARISIPPHLAVDSSRPLRWSNKFNQEDGLMLFEKAKKSKLHLFIYFRRADIPQRCQTIYQRPVSFVRFRNVLVFHDKVWIVSLLPKFQVTEPPLVICMWLLNEGVCTYPPYLEAYFIHPQYGVLSLLCSGDKTLLSHKTNKLRGL
jgi:hypothetical protein